MIAVIADDFTGAAELAGISLRYGLKVALSLDKASSTNEDILVVSNNSRSLSKQDALNATKKAVQNVVAIKPFFIYKKIDSVLRGHVIDEINIQMQMTGYNKAFILPANPSLGRTIKDGKYFVDGQKIHETAFATDPEFPINSSSIIEMPGYDQVNVLKHTDLLPEQGIVIGEAETSNDVIAWTNKIDKSWMLAGAGDFYESILQRQFSLKEERNFQLALPCLYVCGTSFDKSKNFIRKVDEKSGCVAYLTGKKETENIGRDFFQQVSDAFKIHGRAIVAYDENSVPYSASATLLRTIMAKAVRQVMERETIAELFIEGGSTATAIFEELNIKNLTPVNELQRGALRMKAGSLYITVKPGSYELPLQIKNLFSLGSQKNHPDN
jgi:D-threonate/D-erythronate kinase